MIKKLITLLISSLFIFVSCAKTNDEVIEENNKVAVSTYFKETNNTTKTINFLGKSYQNTKYIPLGNLLFFPDPKNNERLSVLNISQNIETINENMIIDTFNYNTSSITTDGNYIYFSSTVPNKGLYRLDYSKKEIIKLNDDTSLDIIYKDDVLYYINLSDKKIYSYSVKTKEKKLLSNYMASNLIINTDYLLYKNLSDHSKLYILKIDGSQNLKVIDLPIDSFALYNNNIVFSDTNDNDYIYSLNTSSFEVNRILNINSSNLKEYNNELYFINSSSPNSLRKLIYDIENDSYSSIEVYPHFINQYYINDDIIFIESASALDDVKIIKSN